MPETRDSFISFTGADTQIATALNDALRAAGFSTWFHPTDKPKGAGIADWMEVALDQSRQMIAVCSEAYFDREKGYSRAERQSMFWEDPTNNQPLLILVRVEACSFPRLIAQNEYIDLTGLQAPEAAEKLVADLQGEQARQARLAAEALAQDRRPPEVFNVPGGPSALFTGRDTEMTTLHARLKSNAATAITAVAGAGGIGKSTLAREYAHRHGLASRYGGVWWIPADSRSGILAAYEALAERPQVGVEPEDDQEKTARAVRDWLARQPAAKPWLVIFDNAPDDASVAEWLPRGTARVLITSRYLEFDPTVADQMPLEYWDDDTTAAFLMERAGRGTEAEALALAERLAGLPLAAEQAGAYLAARRTVGFADYADKLVERLKVKPKALPAAYPDSVWATTAAALDAVLEREEGAAAQGILTLCAFLSPDGVDLQLLTRCAEQTDILPDPPRGALTDDRVHEALRALTSYALLRVGEDAAGPVLILHRLLAEVARARLSEEAVATWSGAAVRMICAVMPYQVDDPPTWPLCARLAPQAKALQGLAPGPGPVGEALGYVLNQAAVYLDARGDVGGAIALLRRRVALGEVVHTNNPEKIANALDNLAGRLAERDETWDDAEAAFARAYEIKAAVLDPADPSLAVTLSNWGAIPWRLGNFAKAVERIGQAAEIFKAAHGEVSTHYAVALNNLGAVYRDWARATGDADLRRKEREVTEQDTRITRALRGPRHPEMAATFNNLAVMAADAGDMTGAAEEMAKAVAVMSSLDLLSHPNTQDAIATLHYLWTQSGQADKAARLAAGDASDLIPVIRQIEEEHLAWVAEDPDTRDFGPLSPVTGARD